MIESIVDRIVKRIESITIGTLLLSDYYFKEQFLDFGRTVFMVN